MSDNRHHEAARSDGQIELQHLPAVLLKDDKPNGDTPTDRDSPASHDGARSRTVEKTTLRQDNRLSFRYLIAWWNFHVDPKLIAHDETGHVVHDPRDFLALERTHLAWIRTSNAIALFGVTLAQLFILNDAGLVYGKVLSSCAYGIAIMVATYSCFRAVWIQDKIIVGRVATTARVFCVVAALMLMLFLAVFVVNLVL